MMRKRRRSPPGRRAADVNIFERVPCNAGHSFLLEVKMINAKTKIEKRNIQNKLRRLRKGQGVTQEELAQRIGCSRQALNMFEQGKTWSSEWEERYNIALGFEKKEPGEILGKALPDQGEPLETPHDEEGGAGDTESAPGATPRGDEDKQGGDES